MRDPGDPAAGLATLEMLLEAGASPYAEAYGDGGTPLAIALFWGHRMLAERLAQVALAPLNLRVAAGLGRLDLMQRFFQNGRLEPEAGWHREFHRPHSGFPPWRPTDTEHEILADALTYAARSGRIDAMALLLERGADIDAEPYNGTALHWAVARRRPAAAALLLDHGADIDRRAAFGGTRGVTPLHVAAAWEGIPDCARLLLARGADRSIKDAQHDGTPASWAAFFKNEEIRQMIRVRRSADYANVGRKPREVAIRRAQDQSMLDRKSRKMGVGDQGARHPRRRHQRPEDFGMARSRFGYPGRLAVEPSHDAQPCFRHGSRRSKDPLIGHKSHKSEEADPRQADARRAVQLLIKPDTRFLVLRIRGGMRINQNIRIDEDHL